MTSLRRTIEEGQSGVYRLETDQLGELAALAREADLSLHHVDLSTATNEAAIFAALSSALRFPRWFGGNWDALQDVVGDLSWLPESRGVALVVEGTDAVRATAPDELDTLIDVLRTAATYWQSEKRPFLVLIVGREPPGLPALR